MGCPRVVGSTWAIRGHTPRGRDFVKARLEETLCVGVVGCVLCPFRNTERWLEVRWVSAPEVESSSRPERGSGLGAPWNLRRDSSRRPSRRDLFQESVHHRPGPRHRRTAGDGRCSYRRPSRIRGRVGRVLRGRLHPHPVLGAPVVTRPRTVDSAGAASALAARSNYPRCPRPQLIRFRATIGSVPTFPSMKAGDLQRVLERELGYYVHTQKGSHRKLRADGRPMLTFAFHDGQEIAPGLVRKILRDAGVSDIESAQILGLG